MQKREREREKDTSEAKEDRSNHCFDFFLSDGMKDALDHALDRKITIAKCSSVRSDII